MLVKSLITLNSRNFTFREQFNVPLFNYATNSVGKH